jgi:preprotein translocase subunit YajC
MNGILGWIIALVIISVVFWILIYDYQRKKNRDDKEFLKDLEIQGIRKKKKKVAVKK